MNVKVIQNGDGYQLQRLKPSGEIANVRPATVEEFLLFTKLSAQVEATRRALVSSVEHADRARTAARRNVELAEDLSQMRIRAEAAEASYDELRAAQPAAMQEAFNSGAATAKQTAAAYVPSGRTAAHNVF